MPFFDAHNHVHLAGDGPRLGGMLDRARQAGVSRMACNSVEQKDWPVVADLARRHPSVLACFGIHPWYAKTAEGEWLRELESRLLAAPSCLGEIGLDRAVKGADLPQQERVFLLQADLAERLGRPMMLHCVRAWDRMMARLRRVPPGRPFLLHAYSGPAELVGELAGLGAFFSFGGDVADPWRTKLRKALAAVPADRLLFETDAPPEEDGCADWYAEPAGVARVVALAAKVLGRRPEELARAAWENGEALLGGLV